MHAKGTKQVRESAAASDCTKMSCIRKVEEPRNENWVRTKYSGFTVHSFGRVNIVLFQLNVHRFGRVWGWYPRLSWQRNMCKHHRKLHLYVCGWLHWRWTPMSRSVRKSIYTTVNRVEESNGVVRIMSWYPNSMEAILPCHPALFTKRLDWVAK